MGYPQSGGLNAYFIADIPVGTQTLGVSQLTTIDLSAAAGTQGEWICMKPCTIKQLQFVVSDVAVVGTTTAPSVVFKKRPTPNSTASQSVVGTLTIPTGTAIGKVLYKEVETDFSIGDSLQITWVQAVGSAAGKGLPSVLAFDDPEAPANMSDMIVSA